MSAPYIPPHDGKMHTANTEFGGWSEPMRNTPIEAYEEVDDPEIYDADEAWDDRPDDWSDNPQGSMPALRFAIIAALVGVAALLLTMPTAVAAVYYTMGVR